MNDASALRMAIFVDPVLIAMGPPNGANSLRVNESPIARPRPISKTLRESGSMAIILPDSPFLNEDNLF